MKKLLLICLLLGQTILGKTQTTQVSADQLLTNAINEKKCVGIAGGYAVDGKIIWANAAGLSDKKKKTPFQINTKTRIASIAKPMTAIAIMQLFEQGKIDLDAPLQKYIPDFPNKKEGQITVRHLLQHASGIGAYKSKKEANNKKNYATLTDASKIFRDRDLLFIPGKGFNYTTYGYVILGIVIENVSGMSYEEYLKANIWDKAGMENTSVERQKVEYKNKSETYHRNNRGKIKKAKCNDLSDRVPGGGIQSTVTDLLKFGNAVLDHTLIKESTLQMMIVDSGLKKEGNGYGFGWYLYGDNPKHGNVFGHTGTQLGASTMLFIVPDKNICSVTVANTSGIWKEVFGIAFRLFDIAGT